MDNARQRRPALVADRVGLLLGGGLEFGGARHELRRDRVGRIGGIDQRRHLLGQRDRIPFRHPPHLVEPLGRDKAAINEIIGAQSHVYTP